MLLDRARALIPRLAERAPAATAARQLPPETIAEYHEAGILRILQPKRFGGLQGRFSIFSRIVEELTWGCASSAWVYAVLGRAPVDRHRLSRSRRRSTSGATTRWRSSPRRWRRAPPRRGHRRLAAQRQLQLFQRLRLRAVGGHRRLSRRDGRHAARRLSAGAARRCRDRRRLARARACAAPAANRWCCTTCSSRNTGR